MIKRLLLVLVTAVLGIGGVRGEGTYRLEQVTSVEAGGLYVFEQDGRVMTSNLDTDKLKSTSSYNTTGLTGKENYVWTLEGSDNKFYMKSTSNTDLPYLENKKGSSSSTSSNLSFKKEPGTALWSFNFQTDNTVLIQNVTNDNRYLAYGFQVTTYKAYLPADMTYAHAIKVFKLVEEEFADVTLNAACHDDNDMVFSTFSSSTPLIVPENLTVAEVGVKGDQIQVSCYKTGDVVPANTGVMVASSAGGTYSMAVTSSQGQSVLGTANCLRPSGEGITADQMAAKDPNCTFYRLTMHNGTNIGFWWGAENGAAFNLTANKAYLAIPNSSAAKTEGLWADIETGISILENKRMDAATFNLSGVRTNVRGIVIKNGKKFIAK